MLDDADFFKLAVTPTYHIASGYRIAEGYYYHMGHSWALFEHGGRIRVGFDDFLVKVFGAPQRLELPPLGAKLKQDQAGLLFGRNGDHAGVLSPVNGTVLAVNHRAAADPEIAHHDPYEEGWLLVMEPDIPKRNLKRLFFGEESYNWMELENMKLMTLMGPEYEKLVATGGELVSDVYGNVPGLEWKSLVYTFLHTEEA
jgi:glycine cleavage system H lipoate-binding protein